MELVISKESERSAASESSCEIIITFSLDIFDVFSYFSIPQKRNKVCDGTRRVEGATSEGIFERLAIY